MVTQSYSKSLILLKQKLAKHKKCMKWWYSLQDLGNLNFPVFFVGQEVEEKKCGKIPQILSQVSPFHTFFVLCKFLFGHPVDSVYVRKRVWLRSQISRAVILFIKQRLKSRQMCNEGFNNVNIIIISTTLAKTIIKKSSELHFAFFS